MMIVLNPQFIIKKSTKSKTGKTIAFWQLKK